MDKNLESMITKRIYHLLRVRTAGKIEVTLVNDVLYISVKWRQFDYNSEYTNLSEAILNGDFNSYKVVNQFVNEWRNFIHNEIDEMIFHNTKTWSASPNERSNKEKNKQNTVRGFE